MLDDVPLKDKDEIKPESRVTVDDIDNLLGIRKDVLDHGFVRVVDYMGDDSSIVQAARISYGKGTKKASEDRSLIRYLMRHRHTTPFEMCELKLHIKAPMFVARQWLRHRTASVNEYSGRYSVIEDDFYKPECQNMAFQDSNNAQGREGMIDKSHAMSIIKDLESSYESSYNKYEEFLDSKLSRELARIILPMSCYTQFYWKIDLHNLFHFLHLRADSHSQYEIRVYANAILDIVKLWVPVAYEAFMDYCMHSTEVSHTGMDVIKSMIAGKNVKRSETNILKREWNELMISLGLNDLTE